MPAYTKYWQYACVRCRSRKIKCDKLLPACSHCSEAKAGCVYLARRPRERTRTDITSPPSLLPATQKPEPTSSTPQKPGDTRDILDTRFDSRDESDDEDDALLPREMRYSALAAGPGHGPRYLDSGKLVVSFEEGKARYVDSNKAKQISNIHRILKNDAEQMSGQGIVALGPTTTQHSASGGSSPCYTAKSSSARFCPPTGRMRILWRYYEKNLDALVKVLHKSTVEALLSRASEIENGATAPTSVDIGSQALLCAIALATITAMSATETQQILHEDREELLLQYRSATEGALGAAGWMTTQEMVVLQALLLFIIYSPPNNVRVTWMLCNMALGLAQTMGMHSYNASLSLCRVGSETSRRIWWTLCLLANRISEECGLEASLPLTMDNLLPLNINDSDLDKPPTSALESREGLTETTLTLAKIESAQTTIRLTRLHHTNPSESQAEIGNAIQAQIRRYEKHYLPYFSGTSDLDRLCFLSIRLLIAKLWKFACTHDKSRTISDTAQLALREDMFSHNVQVLEILHQLPNRFRPFGWFFRCKYTQWHAMAYLLLELQTGYRNSHTGRAWIILDAIFADSGDGAAQVALSVPSGTKHQTKAKLWQAMLRLYRCVREARSNGVLQSLNDSPVSFDSGSALGTSSGTDSLPQDPPANGLLGDPFVGSGVGIDEEMNWGQLDEWVQMLQSDDMGFSSTTTDVQTDSATTRILGLW